jgi:hypothetical protein
MAGICLPSAMYSVIPTAYSYKGLNYGMTTDYAYIIFSNRPNVIVKIIKDSTLIIIKEKGYLML